jgi:Mrp family chromosome partitioning ATPase
LLGNLPPIEIDTERWAGGSEQWVGGSEQWVIDSDMQTTDDAPSHVAHTEPALDHRQPPAAHRSPAVIDNPQSAILNQQSAPEFKPAWQVERFTWPRVCRRLIGRAADELDRLADALLTANANGQKVLAVAGCRQGEGATTLLLCAARRLAERGIKAVLVDADRARPRLAKRLGVQPQLGWNDISADEGRSLDQAVVEAAANNLALVPLAGPLARPDPAAGDWSRFAPCIETLRTHYEMVLVDPGPLEDIDPIGDALARTAGGRIDALLLVRNQRITPEEDLSEAQRRLAAAGIAVAGLIENFVVA